MELNKLLLVLVLVSYIFSLSTEADGHQTALSPSPSSSSSSNPPYESSNSPNNPCKPLIFLSKFPFLNPPSLVNPVLDELCAATHSPITCSSFITPCLSSGDIVDSYSVLNALILQLSAQVEGAISIAQRYSKIKSQSPSIVQSLDTSIEYYTDVIDELQDGLVLLKANDIPGVRNTFISVITKFGLCDEAFHQHGLIANWPLEGLNEKLTEFAGFGVDISAKLCIKVGDKYLSREDLYRQH